MTSPKLKIISWATQLTAVAIMGQTLYYKFTAHPESVLLFTELEMEPNGRLLIGALELCACILLLIPSSIVYGALLGACLMGGAIIGHITELGWEGPRGQLGILAIVTLVSCFVTILIRHRELPMLKVIRRDTPTERGRKRH